MYEIFGAVCYFTFFSVIRQNCCLSFYNRMVIRIGWKNRFWVLLFSNSHVNQIGLPLSIYTMKTETESKKIKEKNLKENTAVEKAGETQKVKHHNFNFIVTLQHQSMVNYAFRFRALICLTVHTEASGRAKRVIDELFLVASITAQAYVNNPKQFSGYEK